MSHASHVRSYQCGNLRMTVSSIYPVHGWFIIEIRLRVAVRKSQELLQVNVKLVQNTAINGKMHR